MRRQTLFILAIAAALLAACGKAKPVPATDEETTTDMQPGWPGDSTLYGLACDGCTDTLLVILTDTGNDPDTFNILNASRQQRVFGRPMIGDMLAILLNKDDHKTADIVIDLEELKGDWCYMVKPELRQRAGMTGKVKEEVLPDTLLEELMQPREYGVSIKSGYTAQPIGRSYRAMTSDEESPVVYPPLKRYREWHIQNGRLVLTETRLDSLGNTHAMSSDTADFVLMRRDTLVLRFGSTEQGYYRKAEEKQEP